MELAIAIIWVVGMALGYGLGREGMKYEKDCQIALLREKLRTK